MMDYQISKASEPTRKPWRLAVKEPGRVPRTISTHETKKEALQIGRILAGWRGSVEVLT